MFRPFKIRLRYFPVLCFCLLLGACGDDEEIVSGYAEIYEPLELRINDLEITVQGALIPKKDAKCPDDIPDCHGQLRVAYYRVTGHESYATGRIRPIRCRFTASGSIGFLSSPGAMLGIPFSEGREEGNNLAVCTRRGVDLSTSLIESGWALSDGSLEENNRAEREARRLRKGLWQTEDVSNLAELIDLTPVWDGFYQKKDVQHVLDTCATTRPLICELLGES